MLNWKTFINLWVRKLLRNISSMKYQILIAIYIAMVIGMFSGHWTENGKWEAKIPPAYACTLLGGGFVTLAGTRLYARTKLTEDEDEKDYKVNDENI